MIFPIVIVLGCSFLLFIVGRMLWIWTRDIGRCVQKTGMVMDNIASADVDGGTVYFPLVKYTTFEGEEKTVVANGSGIYEKYEIGSTIIIYYLPLNPDIVYLSNQFPLFLVIGVIIASILEFQAIRYLLKNLKDF